MHIDAEEYKMSQNNIIFIVSPSIWYQGMYPTGILLLSSYLETHNYPNYILDSKISKKRLSNYDREAMIVDKIKKLKPHIVCFSSTHKEFKEVVRINNVVRSKYPEVFTIVGGAQATYRPNDFLSNGFDFVAVGEGEKTLLEFVNEVYSHHNWKSICGLSWKYGYEIYMNRPRSLMDPEELSSAPMPNYKKLDLRYFNFTTSIIRGLPLIGAMILTSRGCPFSCTFCGCNLIFVRRVRFRTFDSIKYEIEYLYYQLNIEGLWIIDDTFTANKKHAKRIAELLKKYNIKWGCQTRADTIDEELFIIFKRCGCVQIDVGVESGNKRILDDVILKGTKISQVLKVFELAKKYQIRTLANFMIGFPTETNLEFNDTVQLAKEIKADVYVFSIVVPLPGTKLYDMVGEHIDPFEYDLLDWNGSELTQKINKSKIGDLIKKRKYLKNKYLIRSIFYSLFSFDNFLFFMTRPHKIKRIRCVVIFLKEHLF